MTKFQEQTDLVTLNK